MTTTYNMKKHQTIYAIIVVHYMHIGRRCTITENDVKTIKILLSNHNSSRVMRFVLLKQVIVGQRR